MTSVIMRFIIVPICVMRVFIIALRFDISSVASLLTVAGSLMLVAVGVNWLFLWSDCRIFQAVHILDF